MKRPNILQSIVKQLCLWSIAFAIGFFVVNAVLFFYERPVGWYDTPHGVSKAIRRPGSLLVHGTEGYSFSRVDENGFLNSGTELANNYILIMGASHTQGKEMPTNKRFHEIVNSHFSNGSSLMAAYNIACDGHFLPSQIQYFKSAVDYYSGASCYIIEIGNVAFPPEEIKAALKQVEYSDADSKIYFDNLSFLPKVKMMIKEYVPLLSMIKSQYQTMGKNKSGHSGVSLDIKSYSEAINEALSLIRSESDKPIVFIYHPTVKILSDGSLAVIKDDVWDAFQEACDRNEIDVIDCSDEFIEQYNIARTVPYGFMNTSLASGHLNAAGHEILAKKIIKYVEERGLTK